MAQQLNRFNRYSGRLAPLHGPRTYGDEGRRESAGEVRVLDVLALFYRRRWLIAGVVFIAIGSAVLYNLFATPIYEARATLVIEPDVPKVVNFRAVIGDEQPGDLQYFETQYQVLRSRAIASKALERQKLWGERDLVAPPGLISRVVRTARATVSAALGAAKTTANAAEKPGDREAAAHEADISSVLGSMSVNPTRQSRIVEIAFDSPDPMLAAKVANGIAQAYIDDAVDLRRQRSEEASKWLSLRLAELRQQVNTSEGALEQYRERRDSVSLEDQQNIVVQKLAQINAAVTAARTDRIEKQALYEQLRSARTSGRGLDSLPPILANGFVQKLQGDLAALQTERAQLAPQLGSLHPDLIKTEAAIEATRRKLTAAIDTVAGAVRNEYFAAQARERSLIGSLEQQKQEVMKLNREAIGYGPLKRDAATTQALFEGLLQRVKEAELSAELETSNARLLDAAAPPRQPAWPRTNLNLIIALFGGLIAGTAAAVGSEYSNRRIASPNDVGDSLNLPLLGITPKIALQNGHVALALPPVFRESLRSLRTSIMLSPEASGIRTLAVTSASPREGKTLVATQLAVAMALAGRHVLLVDGDTRRPALHRMFGISRSPGLTDVLKGDVPLGAVIRRSEIEGLSILPAGKFSDDVVDRMSADGVKELLAESGLVFDLIVIDSPPAMAVSDASIIANAASRVLFVVEADTTVREVAQAAIDRLTAAQASIIGVVLNKADLKRHADYYYPYYRRNDAEYYVPPVDGETQKDPEESATHA